MADLAVREPLDLLLRLEREGKATPTSLVLTEDLDFEQYEALGRYLGHLRDATAWWIGDWLLFGEFAYGELYAQAIEATGRSKQTLKNYVYVASKVPSGRRHAALSWTHHRVVAPLEPQDQKRWLDRAEREGWSVEELNGVLREPAPIEARRESEPVVLTREDAVRAAAMMEMHIDEYVGPESDKEAQHFSAIARAIREAASPNGRVVVAVSHGNEKPCPACGGSGVAE